jgi:hypothetical protein
MLVAHTASCCSSGPASSSDATGDSTRFDGVLEVLVWVWDVSQGRLGPHPLWRQVMDGRALTGLMEIGAWG